MTRVLLYSDEPILAKGLESVLRQIEDFELLPTSNTLASLMEQITQGLPDLVLMDVRMPDVTGLEAASQLTRELPGVVVILMSAFQDEGIEKAT